MFTGAHPLFRRYHPFVSAFFGEKWSRLSYDRRHRATNSNAKDCDFMNKFSKALVMTGMAIAAGVTLGAGSASAAPAAPAKAPGHDKIVGFYRSPAACQTAGRIGERRDRWDHHDCVRVRSGVRRGWWALSVRSDPRGHGFPGHSVPGHSFPGHSVPGHSMPGHSLPGHPVPGHPMPGHPVPGHPTTGHPTTGHQVPGHH
jgi:hypothetical protein